MKRPLKALMLLDLHNHACTPLFCHSTRTNCKGLGTMYFLGAIAKYTRVVIGPVVVRTTRGPGLLWDEPTCLVNYISCCNWSISLYIEFCAVPYKAVMRIPDGISITEAAAIRESK